MALRVAASNDVRAAHTCRLVRHPAARQPGEADALVWAKDSKDAHQGFAAGVGCNPRAPAVGAAAGPQQATARASTCASMHPTSLLMQGSDVVKGTLRAAQRARAELSLSVNWPGTRALQRHQRLSAPAQRAPGPLKLRVAPWTGAWGLEPARVGEGRFAARARSPQPHGPLCARACAHKMVSHRSSRAGGSLRRAAPVSDDTVVPSDRFDARVRASSRCLGACTGMGACRPVASGSQKFTEGVRQTLGGAITLPQSARSGQSSCSAARAGRPRRIRGSIYRGARVARAQRGWRPASHADRRLCRAG